MNWQAILDGDRNEIVRNMPWGEYIAAPGLNPSTIAPGCDSMKHLRCARDDDDKSHKRPKDEKALAVGCSTHALILERDKWSDRFAVYDPGTRDNAPPSGRRGTNDWKAFASENPGKDLLLKDWYEASERAADAVLNDRAARPILEATQHEVSVFCRLFDVQCKGRIDCIGRGIMADVKGTTNVNAGPFGKKFVELKYGPRLACYREFFRTQQLSTGEVYIIAHEQSEPFDVVVNFIPHPSLDVYWDRVESKVMQNVRRCIVNDDWPGIANGQKVPIQIPAYDMDEFI